MSVFIFFRAIITGLRGEFYAMMKISQVFYLQEKSITLRLFPIRYESASTETIKEPFALQSYKIVVNNEQKAKKKITSLREV
jgi:hypothetical protein